MDQVHGHVVRRPERRLERIGPGGGQAGHGLGIHPGLPQHDAVSLDVDATTAGAAGELGVLPRRDVGVGLAVPLAQLLDDDRPGRHVDAQGERLGGEDDLHEAAEEELLDTLLEPGQHARVVGGDAASEAVEELGVAEHPEVVLGKVRDPLLDERVDLVALLGGGQSQVRIQALLHRRIAADPAEDEHDRGQQAGPVELLDDLGPRGDPHPAAVADVASAAGLVAALRARRASVAQLPAGEVVARHPEQLGVDPFGAPVGPFVGGVAAAVVGEQVVHPPADDDVLEQRHRPVLLDDGGGVAAHRAEPLAELLGVADRRGERGHRHGLGKVDDHLLPHRATHPVGEVVHLVHDDVAEVDEGPGAGVQHVAQHLGGHHHDRSLAVDRVVAGQQSHVGRAEPGGEVVELLVGQRLDRRRVEALAARGQREVYGELTHDRLAGAGRGRDEHGAPGLELTAGPDLEVVEREVELGCEVGELGHGTTTRNASGTHSMVSGSGPMRSPSAYAVTPAAAMVTRLAWWWR